jgi:hypothetical protein
MSLWLIFLQSDETSSPLRERGLGRLGILGGWLGLRRLLLRSCF